MDEKFFDMIFERKFLKGNNKKVLAVEEALEFERRIIAWNICKIELDDQRNNEIN